MARSTLKAIVAGCQNRDERSYNFVGNMPLVAVDLPLATVLLIIEVTKLETYKNILGKIFDYLIRGTPPSVLTIS